VKRESADFVYKIDNYQILAQMVEKKQLKIVVNIALENQQD
jgi:hypothetical protein